MLSLLPNQVLFEGRDTGFLLKVGINIFTSQGCCQGEVSTTFKEHCLAHHRALINVYEIWGAFGFLLCQGWQWSEQKTLNCALLSKLGKWD